MSDTKVLVPYLPHPADDRAFFPAWVLPASVIFGSLSGYFFLLCFGPLVSDDYLTTIFLDVETPGSFLLLFLISSWPCLLTLFFSTSVMGVYMIPLVFFSRGLAVSLCLMLLLQFSFSPLSLICLLFLLFLFPFSALFLLGEKACHSSLCLRNASSFPQADEKAVSFGSFIFAFFLLLCSVVIRIYLIPGFFFAFLLN